LAAAIIGFTALASLQGTGSIEASRASLNAYNAFVFSTRFSLFWLFLHLFWQPANPWKQRSTHALAWELSSFVVCRQRFKQV
jgi:hypothetical protein